MNNKNFSIIGKFQVGTKEWHNRLPDDIEPVAFVMRYKDDKIDSIRPNVNDKIKIILNVAISKCLADGQVDFVLSGVRIKIYEIINF